MSRPLAPVVLFVFNRPAHTARTLGSLQADPLASQSDLHIYSDGMRSEMDRESVEAVRTLIRNAAGFRKVHLHESNANQGLSRSIVSGVSEILALFGKVIVLEDDLKVAPGFLAFMNEALDQYQSDARIFSISGWSPKISLPKDYSDPVYLCRRGLCWGWATWSDRWKLVDWNVKDYDAFASDRKAVRSFAEAGDDLPDMLRNSMKGRISSWAVRWCYAQFRTATFSLVPVASYVENTGEDDSGTNSKARYHIPAASLAKASDGPVTFPGSLSANSQILQALRKFYSYNWKAKIKRLFVEL